MKATTRGRTGPRGISRFMDVTMIATTVGCASAANMLFPAAGTGTVVLGAVLGIALGLAATKKA